MAHRQIRFGLLLDPAERHVLEQLAQIEGGLSAADILRRLIYKEAQRHELWPTHRTDLQQEPEVQHE